MHNFAAQFAKLQYDDSGASAVEYVVIASVLGLALIPVLTTTSDGLSGLIDRVESYFALF